MSISHTPGPWEHNETDMLQIQAYVMGYAVPVALAQKRTVGAQQAKANARLIAAAPELLEALELMIESVCNIECGEIDRKLAIKDARAALAKVKGGEA